MALPRRAERAGAELDCEPTSALTGAAAAWTVAVIPRTRRAETGQVMVLFGPALYVKARSDAAFLARCWIRAVRVLVVDRYCAIWLRARARESRWHGRSRTRARIRCDARTYPHAKRGG